MYRIRRESGEEVSFGTVDEFNAAVAVGVVTAKAEIFHARAEKWLPIASHPHFKMAHDRINGTAAPKPPVRTPGLTASGQRPALGASGQRPAVGASGQRPALDTSGQRPAVGASGQRPALDTSGQRPAVGASGQRPAATPPQAGAPTAPAAASTTAIGAPAPQLRVVRQEAASATAPADATMTEKPAPRWNSAPRPARAVAPRPAAPVAPPTSDLRLVRADPLNGAVPAPAPPDMDFELLPAPEPIVFKPVAEPTLVEAIAVEPRASEPTAEAVVERAPAAIELVSHEERPSAPRGEVDIINPDRAMPVASSREIPALEIPAPIRDFAPADAAVPAAGRPRSKTPLFIGVGLAAAAAAIIGFFIFKPSSAAPAVPSSTGPKSAPSSTAAAPVASEPAPAPRAPATTAAPKGASRGLGGDMQTHLPTKPSDDAQAASKATIGDGLEPPPDVLPAAPSLGKIGDPAALPTVEAGVAAPGIDRTKALEKTRREIDSSMRSQSGTP